MENLLRLMICFLVRRYYFCFIKLGSWDRTRQTELFIEKLMITRSSCVIPDGVEDSIRKWIQSRRSWRLMIPRGRFLAKLELFLCSFIPYVLFKFTNSWMFYLLKYFSLIFAILLRDMFTVYENVNCLSFNDSKSSFSFCLHPVSKRDGVGQGRTIIGRRLLRVAYLCLGCSNRAWRTFRNVTFGQVNTCMNSQCMREHNNVCESGP